MDPQVIIDNAVKREEMTYVLPIEGEELSNIKTEFSNVSIIEAKMLEEEKERKKDFKAELAPYSLKKAELMQELRTKVREYKDIVYLVENYDDNTMETYTKDGVCVQTRPLLPGEKQLRIQSQTGTND